MLKQKAGSRISKAKKNMQELSDTIKRPNINIAGVPEGVERDAGLKYVFIEIIDETVPNMEKE